MHTRVYKLYATASADTNAAAQITIQRPGLISFIDLDSYFNSTPANAQAIQCELSFASVNQLQTNDPTGVIALGYSNILFTTSGQSGGNMNKQWSNIAIPVVEGDRIYAHVLQDGTLTWIVAWHLYIVEKH